MKSSGMGHNLGIFFIGLIYVLCASASETTSPMEAWSNARASSDFSGIVLIIKDNKILFDEGYGLADKENHRPFTADTVIDVLSLTKQFTAAAILKLEEQGELSVDDTLDRFFLVKAMKHFYMSTCSSRQA